MEIKALVSQMTLEELSLIHISANVTIQDINISSTGDAIDVGSSSANITCRGRYRHQPT